MNDFISRQDAIEVAKKHWYKPDIVGALAELPSVQLKPKTSESGSVDSEMPEIETDRTTSGDLISRQDALKYALDNIMQDVIGEAGSVSGVYFGSKDFVWIEGSLYLPIERFKEAISKTNEESEASDAEAPSEDEDLGEWQPVLDHNPKYVDGNWEIRSEQSYYGGLPERLPMFKCSKCGTSYTVIGKGREQRELIYVTSRKTPHCPFCGKKMKVGEDNGND